MTLGGFAAHYNHVSVYLRMISITKLTWRQPPRATTVCAAEKPCRSVCQVLEDQTRIEEMMEVCGGEIGRPQTI